MADIDSKCREKLNSDHRFHYHGKAANGGVWMTRPKGTDDGQGMIDLKKPHSGKRTGEVRVYFYGIDDDGLEMKIEIYLPSYCEYYTFFEGFIETENDFDRVFVMLGIN